MPHAHTTADIDLSFVPEHERAEMRRALPRLAEEKAAFEKALPDLLSEVGPLSSAEKYVEVVPRWWGLVFVLSDQAARDLAGGEGAVAAVAATIAALCAAIPGVNIAAGVIAAMLTIYASVIGLMNRGNGVYITALWPSILVPTAWIPTPR